jgi:hypothetical protein
MQIRIMPHLHRIPMAIGSTSIRIPHDLSPPATFGSRGQHQYSEFNTIEGQLPRWPNSKR